MLTDAPAAAAQRTAEPGAVYVAEHMSHDRSCQHLKICVCSCSEVCHITPNVRMLQCVAPAAAGDHAATKAPSRKMPRLVSQWTDADIAAYNAACFSLLREFQTFDENMRTVG